MKTGTYNAIVMTSGIALFFLGVAWLTGDLPIALDFGRDLTRDALIGFPVIGAGLWVFGHAKPDRGEYDR